MTKLKLKDIKDKLKDDSLDLSLCEIKEVPVREIASVRKATNVNLSNNFLVSLPANFIILKQIVKLDLSKNELTEIPENFGEMTQLKHLDLYSNKISRLPLSLGELKNLNWLDLKENPLTEAVASVAGPCSNMHECQVCARNIVNYLSNVKVSIEKKKLELSNTIDETKKITVITKKENKKKKKKNMGKENKTNRDKSEFRIQNKVFQDNDDNVKLTELSSNNICTRKSHKTTGTGLCRSLTCMVVWFFMISSLLTVALISLSWCYEQQTDTFLQNAQMLSGLPLKNYHKHITDYLQHITKYITIQIKSLVDIVNSLYETQFQSNTNAKKEL